MKKITISVDEFEEILKDANRAADYAATSELDARSRDVAINGSDAAAFYTESARTRLQEIADGFGIEVAR